MASIEARRSGSLRMLCASAAFRDFGEVSGGGSWYDSLICSVVYPEAFRGSSPSMTYGSAPAMVSSPG